MSNIAINYLSQPYVTSKDRTNLAISKCRYISKLASTIWM